MDKIPLEEALENIECGKKLERGLPPHSMTVNGINIGDHKDYSFVCCHGFREGYSCFFREIYENRSYCTFNEKVIR